MRTPDFIIQAPAAPLAAGFFDHEEQRLVVYIAEAENAICTKCSYRKAQEIVTGVFAEFLKTGELGEWTRAAEVLR